MSSDTTSSLDSGSEIERSSLGLVTLPGNSQGSQRVATWRIFSVPNKPFVVAEVSVRKLLQKSPLHYLLGCVVLQEVN